MTIVLMNSTDILSLDCEEFSAEKHSWILFHKIYFVGILCELRGFQI